MSVNAARMDRMTIYERAQLAQLRAWQAQAPGWGTRLLAKPAGSAAQLVQAVVPVSALRAVLAGFEKTAGKLGSPQSILRRAGVQALDDLRREPLQSCDRLAKFEERTAMGFAGASGAALGVAGAAGMVVDVPALITQALRVIQRVGLCYGEDWMAQSNQGVAIGIFALTSANSMEEKQAALHALSHAGDLLDTAWREGLERVAERELAKDAAKFSLQTLASRIGLQLGSRKAAGALPVLGAVVGGAVNAWFIHDVAQTARHVFTERWLAAKYPDDPTKPIALAGPSARTRRPANRAAARRNPAPE